MPQAECDKGSIFKQITAGLNLDFSFLIVFLAKAKKKQFASLFTYSGLCE